MNDAVMEQLYLLRNIQEPYDSANGNTMFCDDVDAAIAALKAERERAKRIEAAADKMSGSKSPGDWLEATMEYAEAKKG